MNSYSNSEMIELIINESAMRHSCPLVKEENLNVKISRTAYEKIVRSLTNGLDITETLRRVTSELSDEGNVEIIRYGNINTFFCSIRS